MNFIYFFDFLITHKNFEKNNIDWFCFYTEEILKHLDHNLFSNYINHSKSAYNNTESILKYNKLSHQKINILVNSSHINKNNYSKIICNFGNRKGNSSHSNSNYNLEYSMECELNINTDLILESLFDEKLNPEEINRIKADINTQFIYYNEKEESELIKNHIIKSKKIIENIIIQKDINKTPKFSSKKRNLL